MRGVPKPRVAFEQAVAPLDLAVSPAVHVEHGEAQSIDAGVTTMRGLRVLWPVTCPVMQDVGSEAGDLGLVRGAKVDAEGFHEVRP